MEVGISLHRLIYVRFVLIQRSHIIICAQIATHKKTGNDEKLATKQNTQKIVSGNIQWFRIKKSVWRKRRIKTYVESLFIVLHLTQPLCTLLFLPFNGPFSHHFIVIILFVVVVVGFFLRFWLKSKVYTIAWVHT